MTTTRTRAGEMPSNARSTCASGLAPLGGLALRPGKTTSFGAASGSPTGTASAATSASLKNDRQAGERSSFQDPYVPRSASRSSPPAIVVPPRATRLAARRLVHVLRELVPHPAHGDEVVAVAAELAADGGDMDVHRAVRDDGVRPADGVEQVVAREDAALPGDEMAQELELGRR